MGRLEPGPWTAPESRRQSPDCPPIRSAALCITRARSVALAKRMALPDCSMELLPEVIPSSGLLPVRTWAMTILSRGTVSSSWAISASAVEIRWPISTLPVRMTSAPSRRPSPVRHQRITVEAHRIPEAISTARRTRGWEPQRQRCGASASDASSRLGAGVRPSSPVAATTRPAVQ